MWLLMLVAQHGDNDQVVNNSPDETLAACVPQNVRDARWPVEESHRGLQVMKLYYPYISPIPSG
ncbi:MAG: hypothetical protein JWR69_3932 [Pedosphaera sp.]|nr:hypothetical protein [Pedosphaera sp.]